MGYRRMGVKKAYAAKDPGRSSAHARRAAAVASSWISGLIRMSGREAAIPDRNTDDGGWLLRMVSGEFRAAERAIARESGDLDEDFGAMPILEPTSLENEAFIGATVSEIKR